MISNLQHPQCTDLTFFSIKYMASCNYNVLAHNTPPHPLIKELTKPLYIPFLRNSLPIFKNPATFGCGSCKSGTQPASAASIVEKEGEDEKHRYKWVEIRPENMTEAQKQAVSELPPIMTRRCKAVMKQIICFSEQNGSLQDLVSVWVRFMKPRRTDWLSVLKQLKNMEHPLYLQIVELALLEESFEANVRDYTKLIHCYAEENQLKDAENTFLAMKRRGFVYDQVTLTTMIHMYSKAGNLRLVEQSFEELKLIGEPLDSRSYGSMIMAYIRAGMPDEGEALLREMDDQQLCAGSEVYKALLRAYSMAGDSEGAQRTFDAFQFAGIPPDARVCALLINAYGMAGQSQKARVAFENMRKAGLEPSDRCIALVLAAYEKESKLDEALDFLVGLERVGIMIGKEASDILAGWFGRLGVAKEVELVLRDYAMEQANSKIVAL